MVKELKDRGITTKKGQPITKGYLHRLLKNRVYIGEAVHKGDSYPGEHDAIVPQDLWDILDGRLGPQATLAALMDPFPPLWADQMFDPRFSRS